MGIIEINSLFLLIKYIILKMSREIKTAILVIVSIALFIWGYSFLKGKNLFDNSTKYYIEYEDVEGLTTSSNVTINGLVVGKVSKIELQDTGKVRVEILMNHSIDIARSSVAYIYSPGFIGGRDIAIELDFSNTDYLKSGAYLEGGVRVGLTDKIGTQLDPLQKKLDEVLANANQMLLSLNRILDEETQIGIKAAISDLNGTLANVNGLLATNKPKLDQTMDNLSYMSGNFSKLSDSLVALDIKATFTKLDAASVKLESLLNGIEEGEGSIGMLLKDDRLYDNLANASKEMEELLRDLKEHPKRYVHFSLFGKKAQPYEAPEIETTN